MFLLWRNLLHEIPLYYVIFLKYTNGAEVHSLLIVESDIRHYRVLPWATGPLTLLESIAKVYQTGKSPKLADHLSSDFFLSSSLSHTSTITVEAIKTIQTRKKKTGTNHWVLYSPPIVVQVYNPACLVHKQIIKLTHYTVWKPSYNRATVEQGIKLHLIYL